MLKSRWFKIAFLFVFLIGCIWYFFIKEYNYRITFTISQPTGAVYNSLIRWNNGKMPKDTVVSTIEQIPFSNIKQELIIGDSILKIDWRLKKKNDSTTLVIAKVKDEKHSFKQNLQVLVYKNTFVKQSISAVKNFRKTLIQNQENYKLSQVTEDQIPSTNCLCIALNSLTDSKASTMLKGIYSVMDYVHAYDVNITGDPFVEVTNWEIVKDSIAFNFCFPIEGWSDFPKSNILFFKKTKKKKALKTTFNGNYKISNMAWYHIIDFAKTNNIEIEKLPVEFFLNDPHAGGNDLEWVAEIYMPIVE